MLKASLHKELIEAGCDEAGRGCLAGPVYAAAVILPAGFNHPDLNDSKKLSAKKRYIVRDYILTNSISHGISMADNHEIDEINILNASFLAMHRALDQLSIPPGYIIVDGNRFKPYHKIPHKTIVQGDAKYQSIAAASILAKTARDDYMASLHPEYPTYDWIHNKGYPTLKHRKAILKNGVTVHHRLSFNLYSIQQKLDLKF